jgi:hypothetical protein
MGRSFESIRMGVKDVSTRWLKASKALKKEDQVYGQKLAEMAKKHSSEAFYALDDPLEAAVFSVLLELVKEMDKNERSAWHLFLYRGDWTRQGVWLKQE